MVCKWLGTGCWPDTPCNLHGRMQCMMRRVDDQKFCKFYELKCEPEFKREFKAEFIEPASKEDLERLEKKIESFTKHYNCHQHNVENIRVEVEPEDICHKVKQRIRGETTQPIPKFS